MADWKADSRHELLEQERRLLQALERQAACHTSLTLPADLAVKLEDQRERVRQFSGRIASTASGNQQLESEPSMTESGWHRDLERLQHLLTELQLYCPPAFVDAFVDQILAASAYRQNMLWSLSLKPTQRRDRPIQTSLHQSYVQIPGEHVRQSTCHFVVFHIPAWLSGDGALTCVDIETHPGKGARCLRGNDLLPFRERGTYGTVYRVPFQLTRGQTARIEAGAEVYHPRKSEEILLSYFPSYGFRVQITMPSNYATRFRLKSECYHPGSTPNGIPSDVHDDGREYRVIYSLEGAVLPFQGIRISWDYRAPRHLKQGEQ